MKSAIAEQIVVAAVAAFVTAVINQTFAGRIDYRWIVTGLAVSMVGYGAFQAYGRFPFTTFRVSQGAEDGRALLADG